MKVFRHAIIVLIGITILISCHEDVNSDNGESQTKTDVTIPDVYGEITGDLMGYVYTDGNTPASGAEVSMYSGATITDEYGLFSFSNIGLDAQGTLVTVSKAGLHIGAKMVYPSDDGVTAVRVHLGEIETDYSFANSVGGSTSFESSGDITFAPSTFETLGGATYDGDVAIDLEYFSQADNNFGTELLGGLRGIDGSGRDRVLGIIAGLKIYAHGSGGQEIQCRAEKIYEVQISIPTSLRATAPMKSKLWRYESGTGKYELLGEATRDGAHYLASSNKVGVLLVAEDYPLTTMCARIVDQDNLPAVGYGFLVVVNDLVCGVGSIDNEGFACAIVPSGYELSIRVLHPICNSVLLESAVGSSNDPIFIDELQIEEDREIRSGRVLCDGSPVANASILVSSNQRSYVTATSSDGSFIVDVAHLTCDPTASYDMRAVFGGEISSPIVLDGSTPQDLLIDICQSDCAYTVRYSLSRIDYCTSGDYDAVTADIDSGSGSFSYLWQNGGTGVSNTNIISGGQLCVTVQDLMTGCVTDYCEIIPTYNALEISSIISFNTDCQQNSGQIEISAEGGVKPYEYQWTGDDGFSSIEENLSNLVPGLYQLSLRDAEGCMVIVAAEVFNVLNALNSEIIDECESSEIIILEDPGYGPYQYVWSNGESTQNSLTIFSPGPYAVTVSDQNGCTRSKSFEISKAGSGIDFNLLSVCSDNIVEMLSVDPAYDYAVYSSVLSVPLMLDVADGRLSIDILLVGYDFDIEVSDAISGCASTFSISRPSFSGLSISDISDTSCSDCSDGRILFAVDDNEPCSGGCGFEEVIILDKLTGINMTSENTASELPSGVYYVVATSTEGGCYIAHEEVTVN